MEASHSSAAEEAEATWLTPHCPSFRAIHMQSPSEKAAHALTARRLQGALPHSGRCSPLRAAAAEARQMQTAAAEEAVAEPQRYQERAETDLTAGVAEGRSAERAEPTAEAVVHAIQQSP